MRVDLQNNRYCRFCPYSSDYLFGNPSAERLARRCTDPKTEGDNHIEVIVFDDTSLPVALFDFLRFYFVFVQFSRSNNLFDMPFYGRSRNVEYRGDFFDGHPYRSIRRQSHYNVGGVYGYSSSFHNYASNAIFSISSNCPANACMSRPILSLVMRA